MAKRIESLVSIEIDKSDLASNTMERTINILMDDRERSGVVFEHLAAMDRISINIRRLPVGDFQIDDRLLFERKTLKDFSVSVIDGRFFRQMTQLASSQLKGVLILQGLQGVGAKRAEQLIDRFGNVRNVMNASVEELLSVDGIGEHTARQIKWAVGEPMIPYGENTGLMFDI